MACRQCWTVALDEEEDLDESQHEVREAWRREMQRRREKNEAERREARERNAARVASLRLELAALRARDSDDLTP